MVTRNLFLITIVASIFILLVGGVSGLYTFFYGTRQALSYVAYPIVCFEHRVIVSAYAWSVRSKTIQQLQHELQQRNDEYMQLRAEHNALQATVDFAQETQELRAFKKRYQASACLAQIIAHHCAGDEQYILIDADANKKVTVDMTVVYANSLLGKVITVYPWYSKVQLITDATCKVACYSSKTKTTGIHQGTNTEGATTVTYVPHLATIEPGETIFSSGKGLVFPKGFAIGTITQVEPDGLYKKIDVKPLVTIRDIAYCYLLTERT